MKEKLEDLIDNAPPGHFEGKIPKNKLSQIKQGLRKVTQLMDDVGRFDNNTKKTYIDENSFRKLIKGPARGSEDAIIARLKNIPENNIKKDTRGMEKISWETLIKNMKPPAVIEPPADDPVSPYASLDEVKAAVRKKVPNVPDRAFEADELCRALGVSDAVAAEWYPTNVWNCIVRKLGYWGAVAVSGLAAMAYDLKKQLDAAGTFGTAAFWVIWTIMVAVALAFGAVFALAHIIGCAINPGG